MYVSEGLKYFFIQISWFVGALRQLEFLMNNIMDELTEDKNNTHSFQEVC